MKFVVFVVTWTFSLAVFAHTFSPTEVSVEWLHERQFVMHIETDLVELMQKQLNLQGNSDELIAQVKQLSKIQLYKQLSATKNDWQQHIYLKAAEQTIALNIIYPPSTAKVADMLSLNANSIDYRVTFIAEGQLPPNTQKVQFFFPESFGPIKLKISRPERSLISSGVLTDAYFIAQQQSVSHRAIYIDNILNFIYQGIVHIVPKGLDHILFVLALFLLSNRLSTLLWQVSAFTLAHTVTLGLGMAGVISVPANLVEPLIALSIAYVAIENLRHQTLSKSRVVLVFLFGLMHGLGFASVLLEVGVPQTMWLSSLLAFNIGVELGQLSVIFLAFITLVWFSKKPYYRAYIVQPLSLLIAAMGFYWFVERVFL